MVAQRDDASGNLTFQGKHSQEDLQYYFRQHWIRLVKPFSRALFFGVIVAVFGYALFFWITEEDPLMRRFLLCLLLLLFLISQFEFLLSFYRYFLHVIIVTDRKVHRIKKTLLAFDDHQSVDLWVLQDLKKSQHGIVQNIFGFGTLTLEAQDTILRIHFVPRIRRKYETLMHLREQARDDIRTINRQMPQNGNGGT